MYIVRYHDRKGITPFKHEPRRYTAWIYDQSGKLVEAFCFPDKRKLKNLLRRLNYIN